MSPPDDDQPSTPDDGIGDEGSSPQPPPRIAARGARPHRSWIQRHQYLTVGVAVVLVLAGVGIGLHIADFFWNSSSKGHALIHQYNKNAHRATATPTGACVATPLSDTVTGPQGLVEAPIIALKAPVEAGEDDSVLNVAVGHVTGSSWPSQPGTTLLAAHDVSYFSKIDQLGSGQEVLFTTPCDTYVYRVTGHSIVQAGSPIYSDPSHSIMILETCYPLNALFITSQRYLVTASLSEVVVKRSNVPTAISAPAAPAVPAPPPLLAQGLTLDQNDVQLATLNLTGSPASSWQQGPAPLVDEAAVLAEFFGGLRSAEQNQPTWWASLAPDTPFTAAQPLIGARLNYAGSLSPTLSANGSTLTGGSIDVVISVTGGSAPGHYALHVEEAVSKNELLITRWSLQPQ
jgi:sortase A